MKTQRRRRQEGRTDYGKRVKLLKSEQPRLVVRRTNKYIITQYTVSEDAKDKIVFGINSKALLKYGWPEEFKGSLKSVSASYLTGFLMGKQIQKRKLEQPIVDFGMLRMQHKNKLFAVLKGLIDSGLGISCKEEAFPEEERIKGKSLKEDFSKYFDKIKTRIETEK